MLLPQYKPVSLCHFYKSLLIAFLLVGLDTSVAQTDPFKAPQFTYMNIYSNTGLPRLGWQGVYQYGAADLVVQGTSAVGSSMVFKPNSLIYTGQTNTPKQLRYYEALTLKEITVSPGMSNSSIVVNVTNVSLPTNTKFFVVSKTLSPGYVETSSQVTQVTNTGVFTNTLTGLSNKAGNYLQVGFMMEGVTQTNTNTGQVGLSILSRTITGSTPTFPNTSSSQLLRNGDFNISTNTNYFVFGASLPDDYFWQTFEGAYVGEPANVGSLPSPTGGKVLILDGKPYSGAWYNGDSGTAIVSNGGKVFTLSFDAYFPVGYSASTTSVSFWNDATTTQLYDADLSSQIASSLGSWKKYSVRYIASDSEFNALVTGKLRLKVQPLNRVGTVLLDNFVLTQQDASLVGPQVSVKVGGAEVTNGATVNLFSPLIGYSTPYSVIVQNTGAQDLNVSSVSLASTAFAWSGSQGVVLKPGESRAFTASVSPTSGQLLSGTLTVVSDDKELADRSFVVNLSAKPLSASDDFNSGDATSLGWVPVYDDNSTGFSTYGSVSVSGGRLRLDVDSGNGAGTYPWYYGAKKVFASPGDLDELSSYIDASIRAFGSYNGLTNKVQVYLESLDSSGSATGRISLGEPIDETTLGSTPGIFSPGGTYDVPDGIVDRYALILPEGGEFTNQRERLVDLASDQPNVGLKSGAPAYQLVIMMTDFEFDLGSDKVVEVDSLALELATAPFELVNGGFEFDLSDFGAVSSPLGWLQYPVTGVSKNLVSTSDPIYNASTLELDTDTTFIAYSGAKAAKVYGQNFYSEAGWVGPSQTGVVYQEWSTSGTVGLSVGEPIHARGVAKVYGIDPLTGGSTFKYGFRYMDSSNTPVAPDDVVIINSSNASNDRWVPLVVNGTVPEGTARVQLIVEFTQNSSTDTGAVYLDDLSVGMGEVVASQNIGGSTYNLVWSDEFDGSTLNAGNWTPEVGRGPNNDGWGNNEAQTYTTNSSNLRVEGGSLVIEAIKSGSSWTSARIKSQDKRSFKFGKIEFRAKLPSGVGPWPAAWMMGTNISSVGWPTCGEIDVMEWRGTGGDSNTVGHALHSASRFGANPVQPSVRSSVSNPSTQFHTYGVLWTSNSLVFSIDGVDKATLTPPSADAEAFRKEFFILLNLAMGGSYVGSPIASGLTNATYEVDYVRVYQEQQASPPPLDTTPPVITLAGLGTINVPWGTTYLDAGASAFDAGDNVNVAVSASNSVDTSIPGSYYVIYTASDSKGNIATLSRNVVVYMVNGGTNIGEDGLSDISRYAFGGTSTNALSKSLRPVTSTAQSGGTNQLVVTYYSRTNSNIITIPMVSTNLASTNWTTNGVLVNVLQVVNTNNMVLEKRQATTPMVGRQKFLRLNSELTQ